MYDSRQYLHVEFEDDLKSSTFDMRTKLPNSPLSLKFEFQNSQTSTLNCSFDEGGQLGHVQAVFDAYTKYLQSSLKESTNSQKSMNYQSLYDFYQCQSTNEKTLEELITNNQCLNAHERDQIIKKMKKSSEITDFLSELYYCFKENIFNEITYILFRILQQKIENLSSNAKPIQNEGGFSLPRFNYLQDLQNPQLSEILEFSGISYSNYPSKKTKQQIIKESLTCSELIAYEIYFDSKIKFLSLRECKKEIRNSVSDGSSFLEFFKVLAKSVYLSIEGFLSQSFDEESLFQDFILDSEFQFKSNDLLQENDFSVFEDLSQTTKKFARTLKQLLQDDSENLENIAQVEKKRKLD